MLSNYILRNKIKNLKEKRQLWVGKKMELSNLLREIGITKQAAWKQKTGKTDKIPEGELLLRQTYSIELGNVENEILAINAELTTLYREEDSERNKLMISLFKEVFTNEQMEEINNEVKRRFEGDEPKQLSFSFRRVSEFEDKYYKYRKLSQEQIEKMIQFRITLTRIIESGCEQFGNAEFLKFISPLNQLIIPLKELEKIKKDFLL